MHACVLRSPSGPFKVAQNSESAFRKNVKLPWLLPFYISREPFYIGRGQCEPGLQTHALNKALCSVLVESLETSSDVPALYLITCCSGLFHFYCPCLLMGRGSTQVTSTSIYFDLFLHGCHNLHCFASETILTVLLH